MAVPAVHDFGPLGVNGETPSRLDPRKTLSYDRWSMTIVHRDSSSEAIDVSAPLNSLLTLAAHARIVLEQVTPSRGYRLFDCDLLQMSPELGGRRYGATRFDANVRIFSNVEVTLSTIHGSTGTLIKSAEKIREVLDYIQEKMNESSHYSQERLMGHDVAPTFIFDIQRPDPANNIYNCITFTFEAAKAGGINLYALYNGGRIIPRRDIAPIKELVDKAIDREYPLDEELRDYIQAYDDGSRARERGVETKMVDMTVLGGNGPFVLSHYKKLIREQGLAPDEFHAQVVQEAMEEVRENPLKQSANDAVILGSAPFMLIGGPIANIAAHIFSSVISKRRQKKAAVEFFEEE